MELSSRKHLDPEISPSTYRALFLGCRMRGIICEKLNITPDVVFLDRKCSLKVREMINIFTKGTQT